MSDEKKKANRVDANREARETMGVGVEPLTADHKLTVLSLVSAGATMSEVARRKGMPSYGSICAARREDAAFADALRIAEADCARAILDEAQDMARDTSSADPDAMRVADYYAKAAHAYVEKIAPREYGQLVKIAGDAEQAAVQVNLVSFVPRVKEDDTSV